MRPLSLRERKLVAIGILVLVLAIFWAVILSPVIDGFAQRADQRALLSAAYARNGRLINAVPVVRRQAERQDRMVRDFVVPAANPVLARAALRDRLRGDVNALGGEVIALQDAPAPAGMARAWVQARMTLPQLERLLIRINNTPPYLVTESLRVSADRALETGRLDIVDVRLETSVPYSAAPS